MTVSALTLGGCSSGELEEDAGEAAAASEAVSESSPGPVIVDSDAEVWAVENQWTDTSTAAANKGGMAWGESSGLSWEEKYQKWIQSFEQVPNKSGGAKTLRFPTPWGRKMDSPVLECADTAIWLRMTFASLYHLPFFLSASRNGKKIFMGHFGVVDESGKPATGFPKFRTQYEDHESTWTAEQEWPHDVTLAKKHIGQDDGTSGVDVGGKKLGDGAGAGAYFDELFLNKRAAYLMMLLDTNFGSANLADGVNMFHIKPEAIAPGDALLERFARQGVGHTLPVMTVDAPKPDRLRVTVASGSMPRRQAVWEDAGASAHYFQQDPMGGPGNGSDGTPYAKLGGGLRRWRTAVVDGNRWANIVASADRDVWVSDDDVAAISGRIARFKELLAHDSPEEQRDAALSIIEQARQNLRNLPASCSTRTKREEGFDLLYKAMAELGKSRADTDTEYRKLEDYVFAELEYEKAKTCCWNSSTSAMAAIALDYAEKEKATGEQAGTCKQPTVFAARADGYALWKQHAASMGREADWKDWSEDEACAQRDVAEDGLAERGKAAMCR